MAAKESRKSEILDRWIWNSARMASLASPITRTDDSSPLLILRFSRCSSLDPALARRSETRTEPPQGSERPPSPSTFLQAATTFSRLL
ncbi:hypothetical protein F2Q69_00042967 [Brassica cretica]|uniref:Uncharacterized protein n=1 Tax=Brassica cretica TaxID=69181 RepID=A0A8S9NQG3_BRACR|nr:hypothetical protein F2Q69_00042967 [Brassica cretica]